MSTEEKNKERAYKSPVGCFGRLLGLFVFLVICGLVSAIFYIAKPQDLSGIDGYSKQDPEKVAVSPARDLTEVLRRSLEGGHSVVIRENEINRMLARELEMKQGGFLGDWVELKQVLVRLEDGVAEVIVVREVMGFEMTVSMFLRMEQVEGKDGPAKMVSFHGGGYHESVPLLKKGGRFGSLVVPQGFLILVMPDFRKFRALFEKEIEMAFENMSEIEIRKDSLYLNPKSGSGEEEMIESF